jgi:hypothetical protein
MTGPAIIGFTNDQATRIAGAVYAIEGLRTGGPQPASTYRPGTTTLVKGKLATSVTQDSTLSPSAQAGTFTPWLPADPFDNTSADAASSDYSAITIWPWGLPDKTTLASGTEIIGGYCNGRWYVVSTILPACWASATLAASGTDTNSGVCSMTLVSGVGITISGGDTFEVPRAGTYSIRAGVTIDGDWSHATWTLGLPSINDALLCSVTISGQTWNGKLPWITSPTRGYGDFSIPQQFCAVNNLQLNSGDTIGVAYTLASEGAATGVTWTVAGTATIEWLGS